MDDQVQAIEDARVLIETINAWRLEVTRANETRTIVKELVTELFDKIEASGLPVLKSSIEDLSRKIDLLLGQQDIMIEIVGHVIGKDRKTLEAFQELAKQSLTGAGRDIVAGIVAGHDITVKE